MTRRSRKDPDDRLAPARAPVTGQLHIDVAGDSRVQVAALDDQRLPLEPAEQAPARRASNLSRLDRHRAADRARHGVACGRRPVAFGSLLPATNRRPSPAIPLKPGDPTEPVVSGRSRVASWSLLPATGAIAEGQVVIACRARGNLPLRGRGMDVRVADATYQATIHARQSASAPALCGAPPGSPWTTRRSYVTCAACRTEVERRIATLPGPPKRSPR